MLVVRKTGTQEWILEQSGHICRVTGIFCEEVSLKLIRGQNIDTCKGRNGGLIFKTDRTTGGNKNTIYSKFLLTQCFIGRVSPEIKYVKSLLSPTAISSIL